MNRTPQKNTSTWGYDISSVFVGEDFVFSSRKTYSACTHGLDTWNIIGSLRHTVLTTPSFCTDLLIPPNAQKMKEDKSNNVAALSRRG